MKKECTQIAIVLDRSGSMGSVRDATIEGLNHFIHSQVHTPGCKQLRIAQFDDKYDVIYDGELTCAPRFTRSNYEPRGTTALYDAIGRTVDNLGTDLAKLPESERPAKVLLAIITDGMENASRDYGMKRIADMITHQQGTYSWEFVFIGANQDAILSAQQINIPQRSSLSYNSSPTGTANMMRSLGTYTQSFNAGVSGQSVSFTDADRADAMKQ